jgi:FixJ family two-component response regulator/DNA-binding MarR family transcriptional regulator
MVESSVPGRAGSTEDRKPLRLLIVEDDAVVATELEDALRGSGLAVAVATDGYDGLEWINANGSPDILFTDIQMPRMDGITFVQTMVDALPKGHQCAVIFASAHGTVPHVAAALRLNAIDFLEKPMDRMQVRAAVDVAREKLAARQAVVTRQAELLSEMQDLRNRTDTLITEISRTAPSVERASLLRAPSPLGERSGAPRSTELYSRVIDLLQRVQKSKKRVHVQQVIDETSWDMLLDLMSAHIRGEVVTVTSLCFVSTSPQTTALRRVEDLEAAGLIERQPDQGDRRRRIVTLTPKGIDEMSRYLSAVSTALREAESR